MMGCKRFEAELFHSLSLAKLVPQDHLLRRLDETLDLSFVREYCGEYYSHTGQPSVDPVVIFKMMLLGYLYGITSERRLAEEGSLHLAFRWYLGYDLDEKTPDHSVLSKARRRYDKKLPPRPSSEQSPGRSRNSLRSQALSALSAALQTSPSD
jgi:transposase